MKQPVVHPSRDRPRDQHLQGADSTTRAPRSRRHFPCWGQKLRQTCAAQTGGERGGEYCEMILCRMEGGREREGQLRTHESQYISQRRAKHIYACTACMHTRRLSHAIQRHATHLQQGVQFDIVHLISRFRELRGSEVEEVNKKITRVEEKVALHRA